MTGTVFLLCGLPGSGKTRLAKDLEEKGAVRLTLDNVRSDCARNRSKLRFDE